MSKAMKGFPFGVSITIVSEAAADSIELSEIKADRQARDNLD